MIDGAYRKKRLIVSIEESVSLLCDLQLYKLKILNLSSLKQLLKALKWVNKCPTRNEMKYIYEARAIYPVSFNGIIKQVLLTQDSKQR